MPPRNRSCARAWSERRIGFMKTSLQHEALTLARQCAETDTLRLKEVLHGLLEPLVSFRQELPVRPKARATRNADAGAVEILKTMADRRPVRLVQNGARHVNHEIGVDAEEMSIERRVVKLAEGQAVRHHGLAARMAVGQDVGGLEQLLVAQAADRATFLVGREHPLAEALLMESLAGGAGGGISARLTLHPPFHAGSPGQGTGPSDGGLGRPRARTLG